MTEVSCTANCIAAVQAEYMLGCGVDSLIDLYVLGTLERAERIRGETVSQSRSR